MIAGQRRCRLQEGHPISNPVTDEKVSQGRNGKVAEDLRQCVDLILVANRTYFQKGKTGMHRQHQNGAHQ
ncbi:hypothetical protein D3C78_1851510 [compost metagenome]